MKNSKVGRKSDPLFIFLVIILSGGLFGFFWFVLKVKDLRRYRGKGLSSWFILALIPINILNSGFWSTSAGIEVFIIPVLSLLFLLYISFRMPFVIERELAKLGVNNSQWFEIGSLQVIAITLSFLGVYVEELYNTPYAPGFFDYAKYLVIPGFVLQCMWFYFIQKNLNQLWQLAEATKPFALPDMVNSECSDTMSVDKEE